MEPLSPSDPDFDPISDEFAKALEAFERGARPPAPAATAEVVVGARVHGKVVAVGDEHALIDFGGRSEAVTEVRPYRTEDGTLRIAVGDELDLFVIEAGDQIVLAASIRADAHAGLEHLRSALAALVPVTGRVTGLNAGGLAVDVGGVRAFCPVSQIEAGFCADASIYVGRTLEFIVTATGDARGGAVLSRRQLLRRALEEQAARLLTSLKPGDELDGTVARLEPFGAFVDLGGVDGLVHVSEIRHERTGHPRDVLSAGEKVRVRVIRIEAGKEGRTKIALSIKAATPDPWIGIEGRFAPGARVQGVVARLTDFGAFVTLAPGIDGLVHISEAAPLRIAHVKEVLSPGQSIEAVVLGVDSVKKRISLSIRRTQEMLEVPTRVEITPREAERAMTGPKRSPRAREKDSQQVLPPTAPPALAQAPAAAPTAAPELTTMAIALRKAMEEAKRKQK